MRQRQLAGTATLVICLLRSWWRLVVRYPQAPCLDPLRGQEVELVGAGVAEAAAVVEDGVGALASNHWLLFLCSAGFRWAHLHISWILLLHTIFHNSPLLVRF